MLPLSLIVLPISKPTRPTQPLQCILVDFDTVISSIILTADTHQCQLSLRRYIPAVIEATFIPYSPLKEVPQAS